MLIRPLLKGPIPVQPETKTIILVRQFFGSAVKSPLLTAGGSSGDTSTNDRRAYMGMITI